MNKIKTPNIPIWITFIALMLGLFCVGIGMRGLFDPTTVNDFVTGAEDLGYTWAGRMAGTGFALLLAVFLRSPGAYAAAFAASILREVGDAFAAGLGTSDIVPLWFIIVALVIDIVAFVYSMRAVRLEQKNIEV